VYGYTTGQSTEEKIVLTSLMISSAALAASCFFFYLSMKTFTFSDNDD